MMYVYYTWRFNPLVRLFEVLEHIPDLEHIQRVKLFKTETLAKSYINKTLYALERIKETEI